MKHKQRMLGVTTLALAIAATATALAQAPAGTDATKDAAKSAASTGLTLKDALSGQPADQSTPDSQRGAGVPPAPPAPAIKLAGAKGGLNPRRAKMEQNLRLQMAAFGFAGADTQDALIAYIRKEEHSRWPLKQSARRMAQSLNAGATPLPDDQIRAAVTDFRAEVEKDRLRRQQAEAALDAKIGYSQNARLEAMLLLFGIVGDTQVVMIPSPPLPAQPPAPVTVSTTPVNPLPVPPMPVAPATANPAPLLATAPHSSLPFDTMPLPLGTPGASPVLSLQLRSMGNGGPGQERELSREDGFLIGGLRQELLRRFDKNKDHKLDRAERAEALAYLKSALSLKDAEPAADHETPAPASAIASAPPVDAGNTPQSAHDTH